MRTARSVRLAATAGAAIVAGAVCVALMPTGDDAHAADDPEMLVERARVASAGQSFTGVLAMTWESAGRRHRARVLARASGGRIQLGLGPSSVGGRGRERWSGDSASWHELWNEPERVRLPRAGSQWDLGLAGTGHVAGRTATRVVASDPDTGKPRARLWIDTASGLLLRRDVLDQHGDALRSVRFVRIQGVGETRPPAVPRDAPGAAPQAIVTLPDGYRAPERTAGYQLLGRYRHPDGSVQLFYSDGLFNLSVFEQKGDVDWGALPSGSNRDIEGTRTRSYATATADVVVWDDDGLVFTTVGDGPPDEVEAVVRSLHTREAHDALDDVAQFVLGPFGWD